MRLRANRKASQLSWRVTFLSLWVAGLMVACAGPGGLPAGEGASARDLPTDSDESEARKRAKIRLELAVNYFEQGQTTVALDEVKQSLAADPAYADAHNLRGLIYMRLNDLTQAEESFRRALAIHPRDPNTLHNYGWLVCLQKRYPESLQMFSQALASPIYNGKAKTYMAQGMCQIRQGNLPEAEQSLVRSYEIDPGNPITGYNLAQLLSQRGDWERAQFYIRRVNNSEYANAETLWLGIRVERRVGDRLAMQQLADQLKKRYPQSRELASFNKGVFDD